MAEAPIKIIAISGTGRTGSTLFALLLSQQAGVFNLGQLRDLWWAYGEAAPCSCQNPLTSCPVHRPAMTEVFGPDVSQGLKQMDEGTRAFIQDAKSLRHWDSAETRHSLRDRHRYLVDTLGKTLTAFVRTTGCHTFIDASKAPEMALAFSLVEGVDLKVLNLVRDPRAVVSSWHKKTKQFRTAISFAAQWALRQRQLEQWAPALSADFLRVRYEDFAARPQDTLNAISAWAGMPLADDLFVSPDEVSLSWGRQHLYPRANERLLAERQTQVIIQPSDGWRGSGNLPLHLIALAFSAPQGWRYVFDKRQGPDA